MVDDCLSSTKGVHWTIPSTNPTMAKRAEACRQHPSFIFFHHAVYVTGWGLRFYWTCLNVTKVSCTPLAPGSAPETGYYLFALVKAM